MEDWDLKLKIGLLKAIYTSKRANRNDISGHLPLLYKLTSTIKPRVLIHNGVRDGNSSSAFALAQIENNNKLIEIDKHNVSDIDLVNIRKKCDNWDFYVKPVEDPAIILKLQKHKGLVDIWFSDTCHSYNGTMFELKTYSKLLSPKGIFLIHDMDPWTSYAEQSRAVDEWLIDNPEWMVQVQKGNNGMAIFYRDEEHLCGVKCDSDLGKGHSYIELENNKNEILKEVLLSKQNNHFDLLPHNKPHLESIIQSPHYNELQITEL